VALALAPISADAQQIFACVSNSDGTLRIVASNTTCRNNEHLLAWSAGAASNFFCDPVGQAVSANSPLSFSSGLISFGSGISPTTGTQFTSFVLQPGIYQIHLSGSFFGFTQRSQIRATLNNAPANGLSHWFTGDMLNNGTFDIEGGDRLVSVGQSNTGLQFVPLADLPSGGAGEGVCFLVITRLQ
jgi:hypothetical protein